MAKKTRDDVPNVNSVTNRDIMQRMNFLYQASLYMNSLSTSRTTQGEDKRATTAQISRSYIKIMKVVGKKTVVKLDPTVKRTICKGCDTLLVPGYTTTVRTKTSPSHGNVVTYTCVACGTSRRIPAPPTLISSFPTSTVPASAAQVDNVTTVDEEQPVNRQPPVGKKKFSHSTRNRKKRPKLHILPLFARETEHVIFRGNERLPQGEGGGSAYV